MVRKIAAELLGTGLLVYFGVGVATLSFGFGTAGLSFAAGVVATALTFGLVLLVLAYVLGPISGCHINPAVTIGVWLSGRIPLAEAAMYWVAEFVGGILGALLLWGTFSASTLYSRSRTGLGTDGLGGGEPHPHRRGGRLPGRSGHGPAFSSSPCSPPRARPRMPPPRTRHRSFTHGGDLIGIPIMGTSVKRAGSLCPALIVGGPPCAKCGCSSSRRWSAAARRRAWTGCCTQRRQWSRWPPASFRSDPGRPV